MRGCPIPPSFGGVGVFVCPATRLGEKDPHQPAPIQRNHPTRRNVSRVTDPTSGRHVASLYALGACPFPTISMSPLHHVQLLSSATFPRHCPRKASLRAFSRANPSQLSVLCQGNCSRRRRHPCKSVVAFRFRFWPETIRVLLRNQRSPCLCALA